MLIWLLVVVKGCAGTEPWSSSATRATLIDWLSAQTVGVVRPMHPRNNGKTRSLPTSRRISPGTSTVAPCRVTWQGLRCGMTSACTAGRQPLAWRLSTGLGGGCGMTSLASSDVVMILASANIQMPRASVDKCRFDSLTDWLIDRVIWPRIQTPGYVPKKNHCTQKTQWFFWVQPPKKPSPKNPHFYFNLILVCTLYATNNAIFYCFKAFKALRYWVFVLFYLFFPACPKKPKNPLGWAF